MQQAVSERGYEELLALKHNWTPGLPRGRLGSMSHSEEVVSQRRAPWKDVKRQLRVPVTALEPDGPVRQILHHRSRWSLAVWLAAAFVAIPSTAEVDLPYKAIADRAGIPWTHGPSSRTAAVTRAIDVLVALGLCERVRRRYDAVKLRLLALDGSRRKYVMPELRESLVIPGAICTNGWLGELPQAALAVLLIAKRESDRQWVRHRPPVGTERFDAGRDWIHDKYGITPTTWAKGKEILGTYGILSWANGVTRGERTQFRSLYTLHLARLERKPEDEPRLRMYKVPRVTHDAASGRAYRQFDVRWEPEVPSGATPLAAREAMPMG